MNRYRLFHKDHNIGAVKQKDADFPNCSGEFEPGADELPDEIRNYIAYSVELERLLNVDEKLWLEYMEANEQRHEDLIKSEEWYLIDDGGKKEKILVPIIGKNTVTWRWDVDGPAGDEQ